MTRPKNHLWLKGLGRVALGAIGLVLLYVLSYIALMDRDLPAVDERGRYAYRSSFLFAPSRRVEGPLTILGPAVSALNVFYKPIDDYWRGLCGYIDAAAENELFATGQVDPGRITNITAFLNPPEMAWAEKYEDVAKGTRIEIAEGAAEELCQALSARPSVLRTHRDGTNATGTIRAVIDGDKAVFVFFWVFEDSAVYVFHPGSAAQDPRAGGHGQNALLPWLEKYVFDGLIGGHPSMSKSLPEWEAGRLRHSNLGSPLVSPLLTHTLSPVQSRCLSPLPRNRRSLRSAPLRSRLGTGRCRSPFA